MTPVFSFPTIFTIPRDYYLFDNLIYMNTYSQKLKHPSWQKKRLQILERDQFTCQICADTETELQIHHKEYIRGHEPWEYEDSNFQTVCKHCHEIIEVLKVDGILVTKAYKLKGKGSYTLFLFLEKKGDRLIAIMKIPFDTEQSEYIAVIPPDMVSEFYEFQKRVKL